MIPDYIGDFDPYDTLKQLDREVLELKRNLITTVENQKVLDLKLDDILRQLRKMPGESTKSYDAYTEFETKSHSEDFDLDHHGGKIQAESSKIKKLIQQLTGTLGKRQR